MSLAARCLLRENNRNVRKLFHTSEITLTNGIDGFGGIPGCYAHPMA